jgi:hypothetical protein
MALLNTTMHNPSIRRTFKRTQRRAGKGTFSPFTVNRVIQLTIEWYIIVINRQLFSQFRPIAKVFGNVRLPHFLALVNKSQLKNNSLDWM